jgi:hypothetical protein
MVLGRIIDDYDGIFTESVKSHHWLGWGCVLLLYFFNLLFELVRSNVVHLSEFIDLPKSQFGLT